MKGVTRDETDLYYGMPESRIVCFQEDFQTLFDRIGLRVNTHAPSIKLVWDVVSFDVLKLSDLFGHGLSEWVVTAKIDQTSVLLSNEIQRP